MLTEKKSCSFARGKPNEKVYSPKYYLIYEMGKHHIKVFTDQYSFNRVFDSLMSEFQIVSRFSNDHNSTICAFVNYYGDEQDFGEIVF